MLQSEGVYSALLEHLAQGVSDFISPMGNPIFPIEFHFVDMFVCGNALDWPADLQLKEAPPHLGLRNLEGPMNTSR